MLEREPINVHPQVKRELSELLLHEFEGTGIGYSAVVRAATIWAKDPGFKAMLIHQQRFINELDRETED